MNERSRRFRRGPARSRVRAILASLEPRGDRLTSLVLRSLVPVICPPEAEPLADAIALHMCLTISATPLLMRHGLGAGLRSYDLAALPRYLRPAHQLTGERAERYFASWEHGITPVQREFAKSVAQLMRLACYEQPAMMAACGYDPAPWMAEVTKKRLAVFADDIRRQDAQILAPDPLRPVRKKEVA